MKSVFTRNFLFKTSVRWWGYSHFSHSATGSPSSPRRAIVSRGKISPKITKTGILWRWQYVRSAVNEVWEAFYDGGLTWVLKNTPYA